MKKIFLIGLAFLTFQAGATELKKMNAVRCAESPKIDGQLNDLCWENAALAEDFVTFQPVSGKKPSQSTEVKLVYDNEAIYLAAMMYDNQPHQIKKQLGERDNLDVNADLFAFGFDTYDDNQNGFRFIVTAAGQQADVRLLPRDEDISWDAIWYSKVSITDEGWIVEAKIPFSALRFPRNDNMKWGCQFARIVRRSNEQSTWNPVDPEIEGLVNQWGELEGLENVKPPLRLSLMPYVSAQVQNSVQDNNRYFATYSAGLDLKLGLSKSFTLDMSLIPDFSQTKSDELTLNLSPFETQYAENRPFFMEGTELFSNGGLFYSRRVGDFPYYRKPLQLEEGEELLRYPTQSKLINALKISGRTDSKLGIGIFNAITADARAEIKLADPNTGSREASVIPLTNHNMLVLDQALKNKSHIRLINCHTWRDGEARDANVSEVSFDFRDPDNTYTLNGYADLSLVKNPAEKLQAGTAYKLGFSKISGHFQFDLMHELMDSKFDQNDMGYLDRNNQLTHFAGLKYLQFEPRGNILNWSSFLGFTHVRHIKPGRFENININAGGDMTFRNYWYAGLFIQSRPTKYYDYYESRVDGLVYRHLPFAYGDLHFGTDNRKKFSMDWNIGFGESPKPKDPYREIGIAPRVKIGNSVSLGYRLLLSADDKSIGYAESDENGLPIFGARNTRNITQSLDMRISFSPKMNLNIFGRYYWFKYWYVEHYRLDEQGEAYPIGYLNPQDPGGSFNSFTVDLVYSWQFAPASYLMFSYKNRLMHIDQDLEAGYFDNMRHSFTQAAENQLSLKCIYYLDWNSLRRNKRSTRG